MYHLLKLYKSLVKIYSNFFKRWCPRTESNRGPIDYKSIALPAELQGHKFLDQFLV